MRTVFIVFILMCSFTPAGLAQDQKPNTPANATEYRKLDVRSSADGFSWTLTPVGKLQWTTNGWLACDVAQLAVVGTAPKIKGVIIVLAESVRCVDGQIATKYYGVAKARSRVGLRGEVVPEILMTQDTITKVRQALENKAEATSTTK